MHTKRILPVTLLCLLAMMAANFAFTPKKTFEGQIIYSLEVKDVPAEQMAMIKSSMPSEMVTSYKDGAVRTVTKGGMTMGMGDVLGVDGKTYILMADKKVAYETSSAMEELTPEQQKELDEVKDKIELIKGESKDILGYKCQKYKMKLSEEMMGGGTLILYVTDQIDLGGASGFSGSTGMDVSKLGIKGTPLWTEMVMPQFTIITKATSIKEKKMDSKLFEVPSDYEVKPMADLEKAMMGE